MKRFFILSLCASVETFQLNNFHTCSSKISTMPQCSAPGCRSGASKTPHIQSFRFPKSESQKKLWLKMMKVVDWEPKSTSVLCIKHFPPDQLVPAGENLNYRGKPKAKASLKEGALPTIFSFRGFPLRQR